MKEDKPSIIKEALTDYNTIVEAAAINAKKKLAEEFPNSFEKLLKEEINKNKTAKESYKKIDNAKESENDDELNKESDMEKQVKETVKVIDTVGKGKPFDGKAVSVKEDVKITNTVGKSDPFNTKKGVQAIEEEREKDFVADVEAETPNQEKGKQKGIAFDINIKGKQKPISNLKEEFDISGLDGNSVDSALGNANDDDEIITIDEIEAEISQMENLGENLPNPNGIKYGTPANQGGDAFKELVAMRNKLDEMINGMNGDQNQGMEEEGEDDLSSLSETEFTDADIEAVIGGGGSGNEMPVDETHGVSFSAGTTMNSKLPSNDYLSTGEANRRRFGESEKKLSRLIEENKKLTKKLNEAKQQIQTSTSLNEEYKTALGKYRVQLKEMAIFNTNLAHSNNLFVNESLALTQDDKIKIINEFKKVNSIADSQNVYKSFLSEMKNNKKTISESIENKVSASIQPSSKQKLEEVVEKTAYANDAHMVKMRKLIDYVEHRGKK